MAETDYRTSADWRCKVEDMCVGGSLLLAAKTWSGRTSSAAEACQYTVH